jgi:hypothetical protein
MWEGGLCLAERERLRGLGREKALPLGERGTRVAGVVTLREDGRQGRKRVAETFNSFLKSIGVFGFSELA